jgi:glycosyltransferase involved in cell wall biosynthesis
MQARTLFIVPAFNEGAVIAETIASIISLGFKVVCIDDGSTDDTYFKASENSNVVVLRHCSNVGQGAALETGLEWARRNISKFDFVVTFDADGQHRISDAVQMLKTAALENLDIVLGSRFLQKDNAISIPRTKRLLLPLLAKTYSKTNSMDITDRHNGLRVISSRKLNLFRLKRTDYSHADEFLKIIHKNNLIFSEFPVEIKYTQYSISKGQPLTNGITMIIDRMFRL